MNFRGKLKIRLKKKNQDNSRSTLAKIKKWILEFNNRVEALKEKKNTEKIR